MAHRTGSVTEYQEASSDSPSEADAGEGRRGSAEQLQVASPSGVGNQLSSGDNERQCTICFGEESESPGAMWCRPCRCRGTSQWVHQTCILRWIDEKQKRKGLDTTVRCEQCQYPYRIVLPPPSLVERLKAVVGESVHVMSPFGVFALACTGVLQLSFKLGVIYARVAAGEEVTERWLSESASRPVTTIALTVTPMALLGFGLIRWDDWIVKAGRWSWDQIVGVASRLTAKDGRLGARSSSAEAEGPLIPGGGVGGSDDDIPVAEPEYSDWIMSSLSLPLVSAVCGAALFQSQRWTPMQKSLAGGLAYLMASTTLNIYCNLRSAQRRRKRMIIDFSSS